MIIAKRILKGRVLWSYDYEFAGKRRTVTNRLFSRWYLGLFSFIKPLNNNHEGQIILTGSELLITGDEDLSIPLSSVNELYLGFDALFPATSVKNFGAFWQPLRLEFIIFKETRIIYLTIDYNGLTANNQLWYDTIKALLA